MDSDNNGYILKRNKKTGNYTILKKHSGNKVKRVTLNINDVYLPFGQEHYNNKLLLNAIINDSSNYNRNNIVTLERIVDTFISLRNTDSGKYKYNINDKKFFSFLKLLPDQDTKKYNLRLYIKYGAKITHQKYIGELDYDQLKGKKCNLNIELGSLWVNDITMQYGINLYATHITIIN
jgi:hypothetical protein